MDEAKRITVSRWLFKAHRDLDSAQRLADKSAPLLDTAVYHCQQATEKSLKAFLVFHDVRVLKTHDLEVLVAETVVFTPNYATLSDAAARLTQYATLFRYPGVQLEPTLAEYEQAYREASQFVLITLSLIPAEAHTES